MDTKEFEFCDLSTVFYVHSNSSGRNYWVYVKLNYRI